MEATFILILFIVVFFLSKSISKTNAKCLKRHRRSSTESSPLNRSEYLHDIKQNDLDWLRERWSLADEQVSSRKGSIFPEWFFDKATAKQLDRLERHGISVDKSSILKGQASDLIGMQFELDDDQKSILKFFKQPTGKSLTQTQGQHQIASLFQDEENVKKWENRRPTKGQKEFFIFFDIKPEKGITHSEAEKIIDSLTSEMEDKEDPLLNEWETYEELLDMALDPEYLEIYHMKKPSITLIRKAIQELKKEGKSYQGILDNEGDFFEKLILLKPELERQPTTAT